MKNIGQGTIEYLVVIAIVIIIGLIVATITMNTFDSQTVTHTKNK